MTSDRYNGQSTTGVSKSGPEGPLFVWGPRYWGLVVESHERRISHLIEPVVTSFGYDFVGVQLFGASDSATLRVYIDKPEGITLDDCAQVSNHVSGLLDVENVISGRYHLEVSSPGLDRPLFSEEQFVKYAGEMVNIKLYAAFEGRRNLKGWLHGARLGNVCLEEETGKSWVIPLDLVAMARLIPGDI